MKRRLPVALSILLVAACAEPDTERGARPAALPAAPEEGFRAVVERVLPAIVFIQAEAAPPPEMEMLMPPGHPLVEAPAMVGIGSGVLISEDGYILTNNHVVQDADRVMVVLHDRRLLEARVVGRDPSTEVAVVRIEGTGYPTARIGDSETVAAGDWVLAMGSPLGLQFSVTAGIVSGVGRDIGILRAHADPNSGSAPLEHFIQTDAALSPGNSGGPLLNTRGEVIGINTAVAVPMGGPSGQGFAIPSNLARRVAEQLIQNGEVRRAYMGVLLRDVSPEYARERGLDRVTGAAVRQIETGGPAHAAGVREGDVILAIGDRRLQSVSDLQVQLAQIEPGTTVRLNILRDGRALDLPIALGAVSSRRR